MQRVEIGAGQLQSWESTLAAFYHYALDGAAIA